jgi:CHAT domain-containing protein
MRWGMRDAQPFPGLAHAREWRRTGERALSVSGLTVQRARTACRAAACAADVRSAAPILPAVAALVALAMLAACTSRSPPARTVLAEQCLRVGGGEPVTFEWVMPASGTLRALLRQQGVSVDGSLLVRDQKISGSSIVDRFGEIALVAEVDGHEPVSLQLVSRDSEEIAGEVCVSADLLDPADRSLFAERQAAEAGRAVLARDWKAAAGHYAAAARAFEHLDPDRAAAAYLALSQLSYGQFDRDRESMIFAAHALRSYGPQADPALQGNLVFMQARALLRLSGGAEPPQEVLDLLDRAQELSSLTSTGARMVPRIDTLRGYIRYRANDTRSATQFFEKAAADCEALRDWECYARARQNLAALAEESRGYTVALESYKDAIERLRPEIAPELAADIWINYGRLQATLGLFTRSEASYLRAIQLYATIDECDGARRGLARLGSMLVQVGSISDAIVYLSRATTLSCRELMRIARNPAAQQPTSIAMVSPAESGVRRGGHSPPLLEASCARPHAPEELTQEGRFGVFLGLLGLSDAAMLEQRHEAARRCLAAAQGYSVDLRTELRLVNAQGMERLASGAFEQAAAAFRRAERVADQARLPKTYEYRGLTQLGLARSALMVGSPDEARREATEALQMSSARSDVDQVASSLQVLAHTLRENEPALAARTLLLAAQLMERVPIASLDAEKRATYLAAQHSVFAELTDLFATEAARDPGAAWRAFEIVERGRARSLRHALDQAHDDAAQSARQSEAQYDELLRSIGEHVRENPTAAAWTESLEHLSGLLGDVDAGSDFNREELLKQLTRLNATLVAYAAGTSHMFAFVIDGGQIKVVPLGKREDIDRATSELHGRLRNPESAMADIREASRRLAELVLWPVSPFITRDRIVFVPDDAMHTVPVAVLPWSREKPEHLLVHRAESAITPSAAHAMRYAATTFGRPDTLRLELIGDPVFRSSEWRRECIEGKPASPYSRASRDRAYESWAEGLPRLAGARAEVESIENLARTSRPGARIGVRVGCDATPTALREAVASRADLLHIATHGYVDASRPRLSALALTRDADKDAASSAFGLLEILQLPVRSRLVVLSACETSRGRLLPGEGVLGPAQAFLQAGAASVLASYWRVDDAETALFMSAFYRRLLVDRLTVAAALRQTQIEFASGHRPHTWAAFGLYGQPDASF